MASNRYNQSAPQSPTELGSSRIKIDDLLNPNCDTEPFPRHSPTSWQGTYHHHHHPHYNAYHHSTITHGHQAPQFQPIQYSSKGISPIDTHSEWSDRHCGSSSSSPGPYQRERFPSVSSGSSTVPERRRPPRPKYEEEEMYFIWYHRVDLRQEWKQVRESFNAQFPNRQRNGFQGIQCKYYRFIKEKNCPTLREQRRRRNGDSGGPKHGIHDDSPAYGVVRWCDVWFPWMKEVPPPQK
ncbi:hypothetical protein PRK78_003260 [Emydomyces testavorans]|uniref:Uncharacterized protein n=1 Tax=Emydomyces testavorans TaxID=2070801 RepID=A0AAF0II84_9EURO|nr:hypothetical protein PRK78_003260 [Emydomyces testavorans]